MPNNADPSPDDEKNAAEWSRRVDNAKDETERLELAQKAFSAIRTYGSAQQWKNLKAWGERLQAVAHKYSNNEEIQLLLAKGALNASYYYGAAQDWKRLEAWSKRLKALAQTYPNNEEIQLRLAQSAVHASYHYGSARQWKNLEAWGKRLQALANMYSKNEEIQQELAMGAANASYHYGTAQQWKNLETWGERLQAVANTYPKNEEIQLRLAKSAVNANYHYGAAQNWKRLEAWGERLQALANTYPKNAEIQLELAKGAFNTIKRYGSVQDWKNLEARGERLQAVANTYPNNEEIQLELAKSAVNAISDYGTAQDWKRLEAWGERLQALANTYPKNAEIQLALASGAFNAIYHYGSAQQWKGMEAWSERLDTVAQKHPDDTLIQEALAVGAFIAIYHYGSAQQWKGMEAWGERLDTVAQKHPDDTLIQDALVKGALKAMISYRKFSKLEKKTAWEKWGEFLRPIIQKKKLNNKDISDAFSKADKKEIFRYADTWEWDDEFCALLNHDPTLIKNPALRRLWEAQEGIIELLRVKFSRGPGKAGAEDGTVHQVAHYLSMRDLERMIQVKEDKDKKETAPVPLSLKSVSSANDPMEGKTFQRFLVAGKEDLKNAIPQETMIAMQVSFTCCIDSLNQFRLYGTDGQKTPGTGLCLVFGDDFFAGEDSKESIFYKLKTEEKQTFVKADSTKPEKPKTDEAPDKIPLYWVLYYDDRHNPEKPFFIHTPTRCALRVGEGTPKTYPKWAIKLNQSINNALKEVQKIYSEIMQSKEKTIKESAWRLLIYLRHLVKDAAFAEEQEMRMLTLCSFGEATTLNSEKNLLGVPYFRIVHQDHCVRKIIGGPKLENFSALSTRWRNEIAQYKHYLDDPERNTKKLPPLGKLPEIKFYQSDAPLA